MNHWAAQNPGLADHYDHIARAACEALGLDVDDEDLTPMDVEEAIVDLCKQSDIDKARRERIATACLQGLLVGGPWSPEPSELRLAQKTAVMFADALIAELDKEDA